MAKDVKVKPKQELQQIKELQTKIQELTHGWQRTQADFENYQKRVEGLKVEWLKMANAGLIMELLPVMDNFRRASQHTPIATEEPFDNTQDRQKNKKTEEPFDNTQGGQKLIQWIEGIQQIEKQLETILAQAGLSKIEVKSGDKFDPSLHEAISHEPNEKIPADSVIEATEEGYKLTDKVLRAAKVRVSKGKM